MPNRREFLHTSKVVSLVAATGRGMALVFVLGVQLAASAAVSERVMRVGGTSVHYKLVLPDNYDAAKEYPAVLVMGGGPQTMNTIDGALERNFSAAAEKRGYIVVAPAAPDGDLFFQGGERIYPEFLDTILKSYKIAGGKFHVAGPSNGGIAAMHVAALHPQRFWSATAFPGYLWQASKTKLEALAGVCVFLYVGEHDEYRWHAEMEREAEFLRGLGSIARYTLEHGEAHRITTLAGEHAGRLFDDFETARNGCRQ